VIRWSTSGQWDVVHRTLVQWQNVHRRFQRLLALVVAMLEMIAITSCASFRSPTDAAPTIARVGQPAPELNLPMLDGGVNLLGQERGKVVLLNFWAT
jgi:hypothetical protein